MTTRNERASTALAPAHDDVGLERYETIRRFSKALAAPLSPEDACVQSMPDASPTKWHLAHTTWFFETFVVMPNDTDYRPFDPAFGVLFNSYYNAVGRQHPRPRRGMLTRPSLERVLDYRTHVDRAMIRLLEHGAVSDRGAWIIDVGLHHEQQHQELLLMDAHHLLSCNPTDPVYVDTPASEAGEGAPLSFVEHDGGIEEIGHGGDRFAYDNEGPRHRVLLEPYALANRPVTNAEFVSFVRDGGYRRPELWLADGWDRVRRDGWTAPLYWDERDGEHTVFTLHGRRPVRDADPVCHVSYYEADAYARWAGARLPTEQEWEVTSARMEEHDGQFVEDAVYVPVAASTPGDRVEGMFGGVWEWTASAYAPYPGYRPPEGAIGEYNGKFMVSQYVLRGGSCVTPRSHIRRTYRNFFYPWMRWQYGGIRLARDL